MQKASRARSQVGMTSQPIYTRRPSWGGLHRADRQFRLCEGRLVGGADRERRSPAGSSGRARGDTAAQSPSRWKSSPQPSEPVEPAPPPPPSRNIIDGTQGNDLINGTDGADDIRGHAGKDRISAAPAMTSSTWATRTGALPTGEKATIRSTAALPTTRFSAAMATMCWTEAVARTSCSAAMATTR